MQIDESKYTDAVIDSIASYIASEKMHKHQAFEIDECAQYVADELKFDTAEVVEAFGDLIKDACEHATTENAVTESFIDFLKENEVQDKVEKAEQEQNGGSTNTAEIEGQATKDKSVGTGHNTRKYFIYCNLNVGKVFVCSELEQHEGMISNAFAKLGNFLSKVSGPTLSQNILVAPIDEKSARAYIVNSKGLIKHLNLTPEPQQKQQTQQTQQQEQKQEQPKEMTAEEKQKNEQQGKDLATKV